MSMLSITDKNRKWWVLSAMISCVSMTYIDISVLPVAIPTIHREFNASQEALHWIINGYTLALTVFVLAGGKLGDIFGHRKVFCLGLFLFSAASALCGISPNETFLIISRLLQGVGAAVLIPTTQAIMAANFPREERGKAQGFYVGIGSIFFAIGPFIGGSLTEYISWRMIFYINIPIAAIGFFLALLSVPKTEGRKQPFDFFGFFTLGTGFSLIIIALMQSNQWGWDSALTIGFLIVGISCITFLLTKERTVINPLINTSFYKNRSFLGGNLCIAINQIQVVVLIFWAIYFQTILGYTPAYAGLAAFLSNMPVFFMAPLAGYLSDRFGPKIPVLTGFCLMLFSLIWFINFPQPSVAFLIPSLIPFGCGVPLVFTPSFVTSMNQVPDTERGTASAMIVTLRQFCATLGFAIFGAVFVSMQTSQFGKYLQTDERTKGLTPDDFNGLLSQTSESLQALQALPPPSEAGVEAAFKISYTKAFSMLNELSAFFTVLGILAILFIYKKVKNPPAPKILTKKNI